MPRLRWRFTILSHGRKVRGKWKLCIDFNEPRQLFNLKADNCESKNLPEQHPDTVEHRIGTTETFD